MTSRHKRRRREEEDEQEQEDEQQDEDEQHGEGEGEEKWLSQVAARLATVLPVSLHEARARLQQRLTSGDEQLMQWQQPMDRVTVAAVQEIRHALPCETNGIAARWNNDDHEDIFDRCADLVGKWEELRDAIEKGQKRTQTGKRVHDRDHRLLRAARNHVARARGCRTIAHLGATYPSAVLTKFMRRPRTAFTSRDARPAIKLS